MKPTVKISQWRIMYGVLYGLPENHTSAFVSNRKLIRTSPIQVDNSAEGWVETLNTRYELIGPEVSEDAIYALDDEAFSTHGRWY